MSIQPEWTRPDPGRKYLAQRRGSVYWFFKSSREKWSFKTTDLEEACELYDRTDLRAERPANSKITCEEAWQVFIREHRLSDSTRTMWDGIWRNWARRRLGSKRVAAVEVEDVIAVYRDAERKGRSTDNIHRALSSFFKHCTEGDTNYRPDNPVARVGRTWRPKFETGLVDEEVVVIPDAKIEEMAGLAEVAGNPKRRDEYIGAVQLGAIIRLSPLLGTRISELLAVELTDLKLDPSREQRFEELHVERQLAFRFKAWDESTWTKQLKGRKGTVGTATRVVTISASADTVLCEYIDRGVLEGWLVPGGLLFPNDKGRPRAVNHIIRKISELHAVVGNQVTGTHCFRHTAASNWLSAGMEIKDIAEMLGHDEEICRKRYALMADRTTTNARRRALMNRTPLPAADNRIPVSTRYGTQRVVDLAQAKGLRPHT